MRTEQKTISGRINADGTVAVAGPFSVQKTGTGAYVVRFPDSFRLRTVTASAGAGAAGAACLNYTANSLQISPINIAGSAVDSTLSFTAVGA